MRYREQERCGECDPCQEWILTPRQAPPCDRLCQVCRRVDCATPFHRIIVLVTEERFFWRGRWHDGERYGALMGHPFRVWSDPGRMFITGRVGATLEAHGVHPATCAQRFGGGREAALGMVRQLLIRRLRKGAP